MVGAKNGRYEPSQIREALRLKDAGVPVKEIAKRTGMRESTIFVYTSAEGRKKPAVREALAAMAAAEAAGGASEAPTAPPVARRAPPAVDSAEVARLREEVAYLKKIVAGYWAKEGAS